ncbi:DNA repair protein RAD14 [Picochlorum sp. SENEW3]|nr:DNA repair protein RAD14 [Picochlorum sp. SENEW3]
MEEDGGGFITEELERVIQKQQSQSQGGVEPPHNPTYTSTKYSSYHHVDELRRPEHSSGCRGCSSLSYSQDLFAAFGVHLCRECRKSEKLVSKSTAKQQYLLTDGDLKDLGYIERKNPRKNDWHPMRLYMESQVRDVAYTKYGGQAGLEQEAREKVSKKLEMRLKEKERKTYEEARRSKRIKEIRDALSNEAEACVDRLVDADAEEI